MDLSLENRMKFPYKQICGALGIALSAWTFTGCLADAEGSAVGDAAQDVSGSDSDERPASNATSAPVSASTNTAAQSPGNLSTNASGTNSVSESTEVNKEVPPSAPADVKLSEAVQEVVKLAQSGLGDNVLLLYIEKSTRPFNLDASQIVYLNDIGISNEVIAAMLTHDGASPDLQNSLTNSTQNAIAQNAPGSTNAAGVSPQPGLPIANLSDSNTVAAPQYQVSSNYAALPGQPVYQTQPPQEVIQQPVVVQQPTVVVEDAALAVQPAETYSYFYSSLAPYGGWVLLPDYGWCWRPTIAVLNSGWRPYCHGGRWLYCDSGWYWHSDYSWGWAPFHYGRWYCSPRVGWVWTPGYKWAPSWVTWRRGTDYCGWAPLPPHTRVRSGVGFSYWNHDVGFSFDFGLRREHYTFVPTHDFYNRRVLDHVVPTERTAGIYSRSRIVNDYAVGKDDTVINRGLSPAYVSSHAGAEIRPIAIPDDPRGATRSIRPDRIHRQGSEAIIYRPAPPTPAVVTAHERASERFAQTHRPSAPASPRPSALPPGGSGHAEITRTPRVEERSSPGAFRGTTIARTELPRERFGTPPPVRPEPQVRVTTPVRSSTEVRRPSANTGIASGVPGRTPEIRTRIPEARTPETRTPSGAGSFPPYRGPALATPSPAQGRTVTPSGPLTTGRSQIIPETTRPSAPPVTARPQITPQVPQPSRSIPSTPPQRPIIPAPSTPSPSAPPRTIPGNSGSQRRNTQSSTSATPGNSRAAAPSYTIIRSPRGVANSEISRPPAVAGPSASRPFTPGSTVTISPGGIRGAVPSRGFSAASAPQVIERSEARAAGAPSVITRTAPSIPYMQSRTITPVTRAPQPVSIPQPRVALPSGAASLPVQRSVPQFSAGSSPAHVAPGYSVRAPAAQAPPRVSAPTQSYNAGNTTRSSGRGRVEIGR
jgi:hypothetical protein